ncbi:MAG: hydroxyacylglutathione hydrolase [Alphaproteobacteria bacterium]|nr:hydroxyacylglutathione hydrolase [Alphaproteobacteria bacterium]
MSHIEMQPFICLEDNYGLILHDSPSGATAAVDAPDADAIEKQLRKYGRQLTHIFVTHHHADHTQGIMQLKELFGCKVIGPKAEAEKIPGLDITVEAGGKFTWAGREVFVLGCPGHTKGQIAYHMPSEFAVFAGDTLFSVGCGRVIEGTMEEMFHSVSQFKALSPHTFLYCGHEYTLANCRFALSVDPENRALQARAGEAEQLRGEGRMTCPTTLGDEFKTNPFLRCNDPHIRAALNMAAASDAEVFAELRTRKNAFR